MVSFQLMKEARMYCSLYNYNIGYYKHMSIYAYRSTSVNPPALHNFDNSTFDSTLALLKIRAFWSYGNIPHDSKSKITPLGLTFL